MGGGGEVDSGAAVTLARSRRCGCVSRATERSEGARTTERMRRRQVFISPPKFCFAPEPVFLYAERRRQRSVPFSGHYPVRSVDAAPVPLMWLGGIYSFRVRKY